MTDNDEYRIDSHKLLYHPERVAFWLEASDDWESARNVYPIYLEVSPSGGCNHRCSFCALDYMGYKPRFLDAGVMTDRLQEMGRLGVKSLMFGGEGEPLLHPRFRDLALAAKASGLDLALTTNGVLLKEDLAGDILPLLTWIKVSCNAGTAATYARVHGPRKEDFDKVLFNLNRAVRIKKERGLPVTIGVQILLLPENATETAELARICRDEIEADYLVVKPYSQHQFSNTRCYEAIDYKAYLDLAEDLETYSSDRFKVIFRARTMHKYGHDRIYRTCHSTPFFWGYVMADGSLYSCSAYLGDERFCLGNLHEQDFRSVWEGTLRERNYRLVQNGLDISRCRRNCRMDEVNIYLWQLKNPPAHVNFI